MAKPSVIAASGAPDGSGSGMKVHSGPSAALACVPKQVKGYQLTPSLKLYLWAQGGHGGMWSGEEMTMEILTG